ncbi:hypothetical protein [Streptomyces sp. NPDC047108]|uniref:hypothetical protein n=1 Tax=Streptomyces sp. NPDC047108 TaxID=3155025 RepID=UPI0033F139A8
MSCDPESEQAAFAVEEFERRRSQPTATQRPPPWYAAVSALCPFLATATPDLVPMLHLER